MKSFLCLALLVFSLNAFSAVRYVKLSATSGLRNGTSWTNAYTRIDSAFLAAVSGDTIKVAKGTYQVTYDLNGNAKLILKSGVVYLGGYPNTGNPLDTDRNWKNNETIFTSILSSTHSTSNIIYASGITANTAFDGFVFQDARSTALPSAIYLINSKLEIRNCVFRGNSVLNEVIGCYSGSIPVFINCLFIKNFSDAQFLVKNETGSNSKFINCVWVDNNSKCISNNQSILTAVNCTFFRNASSIILNTGSSILNLQNSILYGNLNPYMDNYNLLNDSLEIVNTNATLNISNCLTQKNYQPGNPSYVTYNPKFVDTSDVDGPDNIFFTADDGLQLANPCSRGIDGGSNSFATGILTDVVGNPRVFGTSIDMGAYEVQSALTSVPKTIFVNKSATGANNGSSWANAYTDLQSALAKCSDTIKVAAGTYLPSNVLNTRPSFWLENKRVLLGGYPNTGNPTDAIRNPAIHQTILSGILFPNYYTSDIIMRGNYLDSTSVLDGFIIKDGKCGIYLANSASPVLKNCTVSNISSPIRGAVIIVTASKPQFINCSFDNNSFSYRGSAVSVSLRSQGIFKNCNFRYNNGAAYFADSCYSIFDSCYFGRNITSTATEFGGAVYLQNNAGGQFNYCNFESNYATLGGCDVYNTNSSSPSFLSCVFTDSTTGHSKGGSVYNNIDCNPVFTKCVFKNISPYYSNGIYINGPGGGIYNRRSSPIFNSCFFTNIRSTVIYNDTLCNPIIINSVVARNSAAFMSNIRSKPTIVNTTIASNVAGSKLIINSDTSILTIRNSILSNNYISSASSDFTVDITNTKAGQVIMNNTITRNFGTNGINGNVVGENARFIDYMNAAGADGKFGTADDGLRLAVCSPAVNSGDNLYISGHNTDITNAIRIHNSIVDMGAYEATTVPNFGRVFYVNSLATGNNSGTSWANAFTSLWPALKNSCVDTIKMATGIYKPAVNNRDSVWKMVRGVTILGGYPLSGNEALRNADVFPTILDGDIGVSNDSTDNSYTLLFLSRPDGPVIIDGLTFRNGLANRIDNYIDTSVTGDYTETLAARFGKFGGGLYQHSGTLTLTNSRFYNNASFLDGGGLYIDIGSAFISKSIFKNNTSNNKGGALSNSTNYINLTIENCIFQLNKAVSAGAIDVKDYANSIKNCVFYGNKASYRGGALFISKYQNSGFGIFNCTFVNNSANIPGGAIYNEAYPRIYNNIFYNNSADYGTNGDDIGNSYCTNNGSCTNPNVYYNMLQNYNVISNFTNQRINIDPIFKNMNDLVGADGIWFTSDDGYKLLACSPAINQGTSNNIDLPVTDIFGNTRANGVAVDLGPHEFDGSTEGSTLLNTSNTTLAANREFLDAQGWTHYYNNCKYLMSFKKNGQNIGTVGDGTFVLKLNTTTKYGTGQPTNLSGATYVSPGVSWNVMNRYWNVTPTVQPADSILVRFPYTNADYNDVKNSNPLIISHQNLVFYKVDAPYLPHDLNVPLSKFHQYFYNTSPSQKFWKYAQQDTFHVSEYFINSFSGGGGGGGTGTNGGALPVHFINFHLQKFPNSLNLVWKTTNEYNNAGFELQRSTDAINFYKVGWVSTTAPSSYDYSFEDKNVNTSSNYFYRLKSISINGEEKFTPIVSGCLCYAAEQSVKISPNPCTDFTFLSSKGFKKEIGTMVMTSLKGQILIQKQILLSENGVGEIDMSTFPSGMYFIKVTTKEKTFVTPIIVK